MRSAGVVGSTLVERRSCAAARLGTIGGDRERERRPVQRWRSSWLAVGSSTSAAGKCGRQRRTWSTSCALYAGLAGTTTSPSRSAATCEITRSALLAAFMRTRSPGRSPAARSRPATARVATSSSPAAHPKSLLLIGVQHRVTGFARPALRPDARQASAGQEIDVSVVQTRGQVRRPGRQPLLCVGHRSFTVASACRRCSRCAVAGPSA